MRIVIDMQGAQTASRFRGIGRYTMALVKEIARQRGEHEITLALNASYSETIEPIRAAFEGLLPFDAIRVFEVAGPVGGHDPANDARRKAAEVMLEAFYASFDPDVIFIPSLFEEFDGEAVTCVHLAQQTIPTVVTLHDLIPYVHRDVYLQDAAMRRWYFNKLDHLRRADLLLAVSDASGREAMAYLNFAMSQVICAPNACDALFRPIALTAAQRESLQQRYGIDRPFVMNAGGIDHRKNIDGLFRAFARLPQHLRQTYALALVGREVAEQKAHFLNIAQQAGLRENELIFTGYVPDDDLALLYNACTLFVFPSWHEGFGLPVLEAMACGKAVIAANSSSLPEVVGREDALFAPRDDAALAAKLTEVLSNAEFREELERHGLEQAKKFSWEASAQHAWQALEALHRTHKKPQMTLPLPQRPRLAFVSPLPPEKTGIADYAAELLPELARHYDITVIVQQAEVSDDWTQANAPIHDAVWFRQHAARFDRILYQIGNSDKHVFMFGLLADIPGVIVLHDFFLSGVYGWVMEESQEYRRHWTKNIYQSHGWPALLQRFKNEKAIWEWPCNLSVLNQSLGVIVHSDFSRRLAQNFYGDLVANDWALVPHLRTPADHIDKKSARKQLGISETNFILCSFGVLGPSKLNSRLLNAWLASPLANDKRCRLVFVGENDGGDYGKNLLERIEQNPANNRINITGWVDTDAYRLWLAAADVAVQLRTLSRGETSGTVLDCMNYGLPTIINSHGAMADLPADVVLRLPDEFTDAQLRDALLTLWKDPALRSELGARARSHILSKHNSRQCADQYAQAIERVYRQRNLGVPGVAQNILRLTPHLVPSELPAFTSALSNNIPPKPQKPQLLLDVTELVHADARTGIQRVTRALLLEITFALGKDWSIEPVYATADQCGFRYARKFMSRLLGIPDDWAEDAPVQVWHGDVFLGLDYSPSIIPTQESTLKNWSARGIRLYFVVHDLLPVTMPEVFPEGSAQHQQRWLETMSLFDGAICVSRHVADELFEWLQVFGKKRERPFCIDWFHHGADLENSAPTRGLPSDAEKTLSAFTQRPTFLMVGTIEPRKGYLQTLQAFDRVWAQGVDANLVIVGKEGWKPLPDAQRRDIPQTVQALRSHPELGQRLFWLEGISDEYLEKVYAAASCLIAASFDEGFGLPLIEAAKHGLPLLVRDIPVFREVTANHAYFFENNRTPEAISTAVQTWLDLYKTGAQPRSDEMPIQTWHESAQQVLSAIHQQKQHYKSWLPDGVRRYWGADPRLYSQVGLRFGKGIRTNGQAGHLLHGPYTQLPPGQYEVRLSALVHHATGLEVLAIVCDQGRTIILKKDHPFQSEGHVRIQERFELAELCKDFEFRLWVAEKTILIIDSVELATLSKEIEIYKASVLDQTYPFSANGNSIATHEHTGCHYYGPYVSLSEGRYRARYELEIVSGSVEFIYADVCTQQAESIEKSEFFVKNDGDKITVDIHFEFSSRKDKVEVRVLSSASTSLKLSGFSIFKKAPEYAESFVFVIKSYSKDLDWAYYNFLSCEKYTAPRANFYIVVPEKEVALFTDRFLRGMRDNEIRSLPFILSEEYIFQKTDQSIPEEFDGWHIQQVVKLCFSKTKIAKNYCTLDSAMIFTKAFDWENELFVGEQIVTTARRHDRKERNDFLLSIDEKGWLHGELVNISESFEYIEKSFKNESDITHHYIAGNGFFSSELLLELNTWSGDRGFTGLISAAPYEFAWYGSFVANRRKDVFFSRDPLIMFPVIDVESATRITEPPLNVPENFFGLLFQPPAINYISPKKIYDLYVK